MTTLLVFALALLAAVFVSDLADRTVLSTAVLFLLAGIVAGRGVLGIMTLDPDDPVVAALAELALFSILFSDGMRVGLKDLASAWRLPGRALFLGLPLTLIGTALLAHWIVGFTWAESFLLGAVLSPTDPVFAAAIVGRAEVPARLRHLLNVESGLNDGLALPIVLALLAVVSAEAFHPARILGEIAGGIAIGIVVPWIAIRLERSRFFSANAAYEPLNAFAIGLLVLAIASLAEANVFLAAFAAGITVATVGPSVREAFHRFGELVAEILKLAALLVFGGADLAAIFGGDSRLGVSVRAVGARRRAVGGLVAVARGQCARLARAGGCGLVRAEGICVGGFRVDGVEALADRQTGMGLGRSDVSSDCPVHHRVDRCAFVDRRPRRAMVRSPPRRHATADRSSARRARIGGRRTRLNAPRGAAARGADHFSMRWALPRGPRRRAVF